MNKLTLTGLGCVFSLAILGQNVQEKVAETAPQLMPAEAAQIKVNAAKITSISTTSVFWSEDFSNGIPSGWTNQGYTQNSSGNLVANAQANWEYRGPNTSPDNTVGSRGAFAGTLGTITSASASNGFVIFDSDYLDNNGNSATMGQGVAPTPHVGTLVTPSLNLSGRSSIELSFSSYARTFQSDFKVAVSNDNGVTFPDTFDVHSNLPVNQSTSTSERISLNISSTAANQSQVKISFIFDGTLCNANGCGYYHWMIDDIELDAIPDNRLEFAPVISTKKIRMQSNGDFNGPHEGHFPLDETEALRFAGSIINSGMATQYNVRMGIDVYIANTYWQRIFSPVIPSLNSQDTVPISNMISNQLLLTSMSDYRFEFFALSDSITKADNAPSHIPAPVTINVTDSIYSLDFGSVDNYFGTNTGVLAAGIEMNLKNAQTLEGVHVLLSNLSDTNGTLTVEVYDTAGFTFGSGSAGPQNQLFLQASNITANDPGTLKYIDFTTPLSLPAGSYYLVIGMINTTDPIRIGNDQSIPQEQGSIFLSSNGGWFASFFNSLSYNSPVIRAAFESNNNVSFSITDVTCPGDSSGSISALVSNSGATYYWSTGDSTSSISGLTAGQYQLTVFLPGSTTNYTLSVGTLSSPTVVNASVQDESCANEKNGSISLSTTGSGPFTYQWGHGPTTANVDSLSPGSYSVFITDSFGCITTKSYTVAPATNSIIKPQLTQSGMAYICQGESLNLGVNNNYNSYQWSNGGTGASLSVDSAGSYYVVVSDGLGCSSYSDTVQVVMQEPYEDLEICMVSFDLNSQHEAKAIFSNPGLPSIDSIILLEKPLGIQNSFSIAGLWRNPSSTEIFDTIINVSHYLPPTDYALVITDTCGNRSALSDIHRSSTLSATRDVSGGAKITWTPYGGLPILKHRIYRADPSLSNYFLLDSVGASSFTYVDADTSLTPRHYFVEVVFDTTLNCSNGSFEGSLTNYWWYNPLSADEYSLIDLKLFPNPATDVLNINNPGQAAEYRIFDLSGKLVQKGQLQPGENSLPVQDLDAGTYLIKLHGKSGALKFSKR